MFADALEFWNPWWSGRTGSLESLVDRLSLQEVRPWFERKEVLAITGVRRSGKTSLMHLLIRECLEYTPADNVLYVNFEDLALEEATVRHVIEEHERLMAPEGMRYVFLDEVQRKPGWEREVKRYYDGSVSIKFVVSGSNSSLLMTEYSTYLTGRDIAYEMFPLSFKEFVEVRGIPIVRELDVVANRLRLQGLLDEYVRHGGFPEVVLTEDVMTKVRLLKGYASAIISRDVIGRHEVREKGKLERLASFLATITSKDTSARSLGKFLKLNTATVEEYLDHFRDAYMFLPVHHFDYSLKTQYVHPRKVYCIDTGLRNAMSFRFSEDIGRLMENLVFLRLMRAGDIYYWKDGKGEVDFVVKEGVEVTRLVQSCYDLSEAKTRRREEGALLRGMKHVGLERGTIVTCDEEGEESMEGKVIVYRPLWRWLVEDDPAP
ncbi:MAG: AAA family ATPase [Thermoplasmata archaeon]|nr:AAA family ATPase [Thermoplasmata archaeon]